MSKDIAREFAKLKSSLLAEKADIEARLIQITEALGTKNVDAQPSPAPRRSIGGKRRRNEMSLKEAIVQVVSKKSLSKQDILDGVLKLGYTFNSKNPINSVNVLLYGSKNPKFKNADGLFSVA